VPFPPNYGAGRPTLPDAAALKQDGTIMAKIGVPHYHNDIGVEKIHIGVKEFQCIGARPPMDHPHVYLDMGADDQIVCPYCSTLFIYDGNLRPDQTDPPYCLFEPQETDVR
jgi:uncharacterized Zn-finger protein